MIRKVITIGNSWGVTLPNEIVKKHGLKKGSQVDISLQIPHSTTYEPITDVELGQLIKDVESRYGNALEELAKLQ